MYRGKFFVSKDVEQFFDNYMLLRGWSVSEGIRPTGIRSNILINGQFFTYPKALLITMDDLLNSIQDFGRYEASGTAELQEIVQ